MLIDTRSVKFNRFLSTNATTVGTSITQSPPQKLKPACNQTTGIIDLAHGGPTSGNGIIILPYGTDTATETFLLELYAWGRVAPKIGQLAEVWMSFLLAAYTCTLCTYHCGIAGGEVDENQLAVGTIVQTIGNANVSSEVISPAGNKQASIILDTKGAELVEPKFAINGSSVSCNAVWSPR
jgi:hypothetical protein